MNVDTIIDIVFCNNLDREYITCDFSELIFSKLFQIIKKKVDPFENANCVPQIV